jgi:hypothetical protein
LVCGADDIVFILDLRLCLICFVRFIFYIFLVDLVVLGGVYLIINGLVHFTDWSTVVY